MIELLTISVTVGVSVLLLGVGYALGRQSARPHAAGGHHATVPLDELRPIKQPGRRLPPPNLDLIDNSGAFRKQADHTRRTLAEMSDDDLSDD